MQSLTLIYDDSQSTMIVMFSPSMGTGVLECIKLTSHLRESKMFVNVVVCNFAIARSLCCCSMNETLNLWIRALQLFVFKNCSYTCWSHGSKYESQVCFLLEFLNCMSYKRTHN